MPTMANGTVARTQVSLRLPAEMAGAVEAYAKQKSIPKTAAYEHFLQLGLSRTKLDSSQGDLRKTNAKLDKILALLSSSSNTQVRSNKEEVIEAISEAALRFLPLNAPICSDRFRVTLSLMKAISISA